MMALDEGGSSDDDIDNDKHKHINDGSGDDNIDNDKHNNHGSGDDDIDNDKHQHNNNDDDDDDDDDVNDFDILDVDAEISTTTSALVEGSSTGGSANVISPIIDQGSIAIASTITTSSGTATINSSSNNRKLPPRSGLHKVCSSTTVCSSSTMLIL